MPRSAFQQELARVTKRRVTTPDEGVDVTRYHATAASIRARVKEIIGQVSIALRVPGRHYSGLSYDDLLAVLASQGRPFGAETAALYAHLRRAVAYELDELPRMPTVATIYDAIERAYIGWVVARFAGKESDVRLQPLTGAYRLDKRKAGYGGRPIGVRTGSLALRVAEYGSAKIKRHT